MAYVDFAYCYDRLTQNINYKSRAQYFHRLILQYAVQKPELVLDLACGTGSLTMALSEFGYDMIGVDGSADMLSVALQKASEQGRSLLYLCQDMTRLDLYGTVDVTICALDSINHLIRSEDVQRTFDRVSLFTNPGGLFLFDVNTVYKHHEILADQTFVYDYDDLYCVWQNTLEKDHVIEISLDFFERNESGSYERRSESFRERAYDTQQLSSFCEKAGFDVLAVYEEDSITPVKESTQRAVYVCRKR